MPELEFTSLAGWRAVFSTDNPLEIYQGRPGMFGQPRLELDGNEPADSVWFAPSGEGWAIHSETDELWYTPSINAAFVPVGPLGLDAHPVNGFTVLDGQGFLAMTPLPDSWDSQLYRIDLSTGQATHVGEIGRDILLQVNALQPVPEANPFVFILVGLLIYLFLYTFKKDQA